MDFDVEVEYSIRIMQNIDTRSLTYFPDLVTFISYRLKSSISSLRNQSGDWETFHLAGSSPFELMSYFLVTYVR